LSNTFLNILLKNFNDFFDISLKDSNAFVEETEMTDYK